MRLEVRQFSPTDGEPTLIGSLPKALEEYGPTIQRYIEVAEKQNCEVDIKQALVTYALYRHGISPKSDSQHPVRLLTTTDISKILGITENDVKRHQRLIEKEEELPAWREFETALLQPAKKKSKEERTEEIKLLLQQGLDAKTIAEQLNISSSVVRGYIKELGELQKTTPPITP